MVFVSLICAADRTRDERKRYANGESSRFVLVSSS